MLAIEVKGLSKEFGSLFGSKRVIAVDHLDLQVEAGKVFGFLGPNGAGKTTTIQMLLGNIYPTNGEAFVLNHPAGDLRAKRHIGFLPEKFQFHDFLTAEEFLIMHGRLAKMDTKWIRRRVPEVLELVGLAERSKSKIREFSKGMQQRAGLAQAILHEPDLIILDEPTSALDPLGRRTVREVIQQLKAQGKTVFLNSHLLSEVEMSCDEVAIINKGRVVRQGALEELLVDRSVVVLEIRNLNGSMLELLSRAAISLDRVGEDRVVVEVAGEDQVPELVRTIVNAGGELMGLQAKRETLEDLFIRTVEGEKA
jgi:ABC-2 type transport system ATP-binding protein